jgi:hypothetical protein
MRIISALAILSITACAHTKAKPAAEAKPEAKAEATAPAPTKAEPAAPAAALAPVRVEILSQSATAVGAPIQDTLYSERKEDAAITKRELDGDVLTYTGQVGLGKGSSYAGIGMYLAIFKAGRTMDATNYKSVTFRLASTAGQLRLRIAGGDQKVREEGCYPVFTQRVTETLTDYTIPLSSFKAESWCGGKGVSAADTLKTLYGYEVADITVAGKPVTVSVVSIVLNP